MNEWRLITRWLRRAAPRPFDLIKAILSASVATLAGNALFVGALGLLVVSAQRPSLGSIGAFLVGLELVAFLRSPLRFSQRMSSHRLGFAAVAQWRRWLMETVTGWDYRRRIARGSGELLERSMRDTEELQDLWLRAAIPTIASLVAVFGGDLAIALFPPRPHGLALALAALATQAVSLGLLVSRVPRLRQIDLALRARRGTFLAELVAVHRAAPEIILLGRGRYLDGRVAAAAQAVADGESLLTRARRASSLITLITSLVLLGECALWAPRGGVWSVASVLVLITSAEAVSTWRAALDTTVAVMAGAQRLDELADDVATGTAPWPDSSDIDLEGVDAGSVRLDAHWPAGARVAIRGASGVGKSTFLRQLAGLESGAVGRVIIGGRERSTIDEEDLRRHLVMVPSDPGLLRGHVLDVMGLGGELDDTTLATLSRVGVVADARDRWTDLSRGERARVAVVRALLRHPDVVVLDEPTSALGVDETEALLRVLGDYRGTVVVASHDPRVWAWCDEVIDLDSAVE